MDIKLFLEVAEEFFDLMYGFSCYDNTDTKETDTKETDKEK
jgi:hypothetical protein